MPALLLNSPYVIVGIRSGIVKYNMLFKKNVSIWSMKDLKYCVEQIKDDLCSSALR